MLTLAILVLVVLMIPITMRLTARAGRSRPEGIRWQGIDWDRARRQAEEEALDQRIEHAAENDGAEKNDEAEKDDTNERNKMPH